MDTVGAWIVYRTVRDRGAKVIGASRDEVSLLKQVGDSTCRPGSLPRSRASFIRVLTELGEWVAETGVTLVGLLGFFGATLIGFANVIRRPGASGSMPSSSASTSSAFARSGSSA